MVSEHNNPAMQQHRYRMWQSKTVAFAMFALLAASIVYWAFQGLGGSVSAVAPLPATSDGPVLDPLSVARALGGGQAPSATPADAAPVSDSRRYALVGVVADTTSGGAALISVDGKPARPVRVGAPVDERLILQSVQGRRASLATGMAAPVEITLQLPAPDKR